MKRCFLLLLVHQEKQLPLLEASNQMNFSRPLHYQLGTNSCFALTSLDYLVVPRALGRLKDLSFYLIFKLSLIPPLLPTCPC